jgi:hypothetical protein
MDGSQMLAALTVISGTVPLYRKAMQNDLKTYVDLTSVD